MTLQRYTFENGPDGAPLTAANCGADNVNVSGTATFDHDTAQVGQFAGRVVNSASNRSTIRFLAAAANSKMAFEVNFQVNGSLPASETNVVNFLDSSNTNGPYVSLDTDGRVSLWAKGGVGGRNVVESVSADTGYRLAVLLEVTSGTTCTYSANLYEGQSTTPINSTPVSGSFDGGLATYNGVYVGLISPVAGDITFDAVSFNDGSTSEIGPAPNPGTPADTVNASSVVSNPGSWSAFGASDLVDVVSDDSDSTGIRSTTAGGSITYALNPLTDGPVTIKVRHKLASGSSGGTRVYQLLQDGTVIKTSESVTLPSSATDYTFGPTTASETAAITDRTKLQLKVTDTAA